MNNAICSVPDCGKRARSKTLCIGHYHRLTRYGDPLGHPERRQYSDPVEAFSARTERRDGHLIWTAGLNGMGYGLIRVDGKSMLAHRYSWETSVGPIPDGAEIDHVCHETRCVAPEHLRIASRAENVRNRNGAQVNNQHTGVRNVYPNTYGYQVRLGGKGNRRSFGTYPTIEEAAEVAERARQEMYGEFAGKGGVNGRSASAGKGTAKPAVPLAVH